jgi:hypothetical protein
MTQLTRLDAKAGAADLLRVIARDGAVIVENLLSTEQVDRTLGELAPYIEATRPGADAFSGFRTTRTGALVRARPAPPDAGDPHPPRPAGPADAPRPLGLGHAPGSYAPGYFTPPLPPGEGPELVGPERALGRAGDGSGRLGSAELFGNLGSRLRGA